MKSIVRSPLVLLVVILLVHAACGKKGPPFLPEKAFPFRVEALKGAADTGGLILSGAVPGLQAGSVDVSGCVIYHACYPLDSPPCDGCPVNLIKLKPVRDNVMTGDRFRCEVAGVETPGIHFIRVRLLGGEGIEGPPSERIKLLIPDE